MSQKELISALEMMKKNHSDRCEFLTSGKLGDLYDETFHEFTLAMEELSLAMKTALPGWGLMWEPVTGRDIIVYHTETPLDYVTVRIGSLFKDLAEGIIGFRDSRRVDTIIRSQADIGPVHGARALPCLMAALHVVLPELLAKAPSQKL